MNGQDEVPDSLPESFEDRYEKQRTMMVTGRRTGIRSIAAIAGLVAGMGVGVDAFSSHKGRANPHNPWTPSYPRETDPDDQARIDAAEAKRQRKMAKRKPK